MSARLHVLAGDGLLHEAGRFAVPSLEAQPARPGEMPESLLVALETAAAARAAAESARTGVPVPLWLRLAVEGSRHVTAAAAMHDSCSAQVEAALDAAAGKVAGGPRPLHGRRQHEYASLLRAASHSRRRRPIIGRSVEIAAPDQVVTAWLLEAAAAAIDLGQFVSEHVLTAPMGVVDWEAAAAETGRGFGEWIYAEALAFTAR